MGADIDDPMHIKVYTTNDGRAVIEQSKTSACAAAILVLILILVALVASALAEASPPRASDLNHVRRLAPRTVFPLNESEWRDATSGMPPGSRYAVITGDPARAEPFVMRVELPQGYRFAPYSRSTDENLIVLSGTLMIGHGRSFDRTRMRALPSGSFQLLRANEAHYMMTIDGATVQIFGPGPFALEYVTSRCMLRSGWDLGERSSALC